MCLLCIASRWSRRIVTMLPWLILPLLVLWAVSQLLPPGFRFEVTSPRLACVGVLFFSLGWYELLMPRLSEWRARRSLMLHERRKIEAQEAAKWRKEAIRKCRNCDTAYKDQKPVGGKFMCTYCGHVSKRPALDVPGAQSGAASSVGQFISRRDLRVQGNRSWTQRMFENDLWPGVWGSGTNTDSCLIGGQNSSVLIVFRLVSFFGYCIYWAFSKLSRGGMSGADRSRAERRGGQRKGDDGNGQESKAEKLRRKAEEKRLARLEKEQMEAEERMQREEVARLVDERRRQRTDAEKEMCVVEQDRKQEKTNNGKAGGAAKCKNAAPQDDSRKPKDKSKKEKKTEESNRGSKQPSGLDTVPKQDEAAKTGTSTGRLLSTKLVVKPGAHLLSKYPVKGRGSAFASLKKPSVPATTTTAPAVKSAATEAVVNKPSAWNRISWAWGKGRESAAVPEKEKVDPLVVVEEKDNKASDVSSENLASKDSETNVVRNEVPEIIRAVTPPPSRISSPSNRTGNETIATAPTSYFGDDTSAVFTTLPQPPSSLSPFSAPFPAPSKVKDATCLSHPPSHSSPAECESCSVYSTFMSPPAVVNVASSTPASALDPWGGNDLLPKSTWQMWDAPQLELPRLTPSLTGPTATLPSEAENPLLNSARVATVPGLPNAVPSLPISNNLWSNYHALESTRRIWEDLDLQSEATPPEFVDCITQEVMKDPVIAADGHSYERLAIEAWLRTHDTSPKTGEVLPALVGGTGGTRVDKSLRPNHNLRGQIIEYRECLQRSWQASAVPTEGLKKGHIGGLYTPPDLGSVWAYNSA